MNQSQEIAKVINQVRADNPLVFKIEGQVPSLKNDKQLITTKEGKQKLIKSSAVRRFIKGVQGGLIRQKNDLPQEVLDSLPIEKEPVGVWVDLKFFSRQPVPRNDGDNAFTMVQELLQTHDKPSGTLGIITDDRYVMLGSFSTQTVPHRDLAGAVVFVWKLGNGNTNDELFPFLRFRESYYESHKPTPSDISSVLGMYDEG